MFKPLVLNVQSHKRYINVKGDKQANRLCMHWMNSLFRRDQLETCWFAASPSHICKTNTELMQVSAGWAAFTTGLLLPKGFVFFPSEQRARNFAHYLLLTNS